MGFNFAMSEVPQFQLGIAPLIPPVVKIWQDKLLAAVKGAIQGAVTTIINK